MISGRDEAPCFATDKSGAAALKDASGVQQSFPPGGWRFAALAYRNADPLPDGAFALRRAERSFERIRAVEPPCSRR